jgi:hypothetical protein
MPVYRNKRFAILRINSALRPLNDVEASYAKCYDTNHNNKCKHHFAFHLLSIDV